MIDKSKFDARMRELDLEALLTGEGREKVGTDDPYTDGPRNDKARRGKKKKNTEAVRVPIEEALKKAAEKVTADFCKTERKIHRFPASLRGLDSRYIVPMAVAIGPYHRALQHLRQMEDVKLAATYHFIRGSKHSPEEMYKAVLSITDEARSLYTTDDAVAGIRRADFAAMMLRDACFLLQYMLMFSANEEVDPSLLCCFSSNKACINNDIMLLENQLPWLVLETVMSFRPVAVEEFIDQLGVDFQVHLDMEKKQFVSYGGDDYRPPVHLLGLLRFCKIGSPSGVPPSESHGSMPKTISAIELAQIGVKLTASETTKFVDMGIKKGRLFGEIFLAPLLLDDLRASWLVNMAAFEVCMVSFRKDTEKAAVCSYLALLAMLMDREEDVHELRTKRLLQGLLTNKETLDFFKSLIKHMYVGPRYVWIMSEIEAYKQDRWMWVKLHELVYNNSKTIVALCSLIGVLVGIFKTLLSLRQHQQ